MDGVSGRDEFLQDLMAERTGLSYAASILGDNIEDTLDALAVACQAVDRVFEPSSVRCSAVGEGCESAGGAISAVNALSHGLKTVKLSCSFDYSKKAFLDLSEEAAKTVRDSAKAVSFWESIGAIQNAPLCTKIVADVASVVASAIGLGNNVVALSETAKSDVASESRWWQNVTEAGANSLSIALSAIALLGLVLAEAYMLALTATLLVCVFASHVFRKDVEQLELINYLRG